MHNPEQMVSQISSYIDIGAHLMTNHSKSNGNKDVRSETRFIDRNKA